MNTLTFAPPRNILPNMGKLLYTRKFWIRVEREKAGMQYIPKIYNNINPNCDSSRRVLGPF